MELLKVAEDLKSLDDTQLADLMQNQSPLAPGFLVLSEMTRREKLRQEQAEPPKGTIAEEKIAQAKAPSSVNGPNFPQSPEQAGIAQFSTGGPVNVRDIVYQTAQRYGLPPDAFWRVAQIESGGGRDLVNERSSARGLFQQIDSNWKTYGRGDRFNPYDSADAAARFWVDNKNYLEGRLGRPLQPHEYYMAHQQGPGGALKILSNPGANAAGLLGHDQVMLNGGNPNMTAGEFAQKWAAKMQAKGDRDSGVASLSYNNSGVGGTSPDLSGIGSLVSEDGDSGGIADIVKASRARQKAEMASNESASKSISSQKFQGREGVEEYMKKVLTPYKKTYAEGGPIGGVSDVYGQGITRPYDPYYDMLSEEERRQLEEIQKQPFEMAPPEGFSEEDIPWAVKKAMEDQNPKPEAPPPPAPPPEERKRVMPGDSRDMPVISPKAPEQPVVPDVPETETGPVDPALHEGGVGGYLTQLMAMQGMDPYGAIQAKIDSMGPKDNPERDKWMDLARFGFTLAATGNVGDAGLAVIEGRDSRQTAHNKAVQQQLELTTELAKARNAYQSGNLGLAVDLYTNAASNASAEKRAAMASGGSDNTLYFKVQEEVGRRFKAQYGDPSDGISKAALMPVEQRAAIIRNLQDQVMVEMQQFGGGGGGGVVDVSDAANGG